jgi:hypothetical protein
LAKTRITRPGVPARVSPSVGGAEHRDAARVVRGQGHGRDALTVGTGQVALIEDHDADGAGGRGVLGLQLERARAALEQRDVPGREAREVSSLAPAGRRVAETELQVDGRDRRGDVSVVALVDDPEVDVLDVGDRAGCRLLESRGPDHLEREVVELLHVDVVAGGVELVGHVVHGGVVAGEA